MKAFRFRIPYPSDGSANNEFKSITLFIEELRSQSIVGRKKRNFQFIFDVTVDGQWIILDPDCQNDGVFRFDQPITQLDTVTMSFGSPLNLINFDVDNMSSTITYAATTVVTTASAHNLVTGNTVTFESFSSANQATDALMNRETGHVITKTGATTFTIAVDTLTPLGAGSQTVTCFFESKTFRVPIEITYVRPGETI